MNDCSENRNPLIRNGTSQEQRALEKQSPVSVEIIDKTIEDWMVWAGKFSDHIAHFALNNAPAGSMKPFFTGNISAQLALAASFQPETLSQYIREVLQFLETEDSKLKDAYTELFDIIFSFFSVVDHLYTSTRSDKEYNGILLNHIQAKLLPVEVRAISYYKASLNASPELIIESQLIDLTIFHEPVHGHEEFVVMGLSSLSGKRYLYSSDFKTYYNAIPSDLSIFGSQTGFVKQIKYVIQHNFFTSILDEISASASFIKSLSQKYIAGYLSDWPDHQPDYALFLTWLQLLGDTRDHLNDLTGRHLDFYYKKVLQLRPLEQSPDKAFLVMELNKVTSRYASAEDTVFIGPKDDGGNIITYKSIKETVLNKAGIKYLSALYYGGANDNIGSQINNGRLFAAPVINSADGLGEKLEDDIIAWHPLHIKEYVNAELVDIHMPGATIGFAIASHYLRLKEGSRTITLEITPSNNIKFNNFSYQAYITIEKEWLEIEDTDLQLAKSGSGYVTRMDFRCTIPADKDPVVAYNQGVHLGSLTATEPVLKIVLEHKDTENFIYDTLSEILVSKVKLTVEVGDVSGTYNENGLKNLELHNDESPLNPSKPFFPWGPEPKVGNSFILGSDEVFYKKGAILQLNFYWKDYPLDSGGNINLSVLDYDSSGSVQYSSYNSTNRTSTNDDGYVPKVEILKLSDNKWITLQNDKQVFRVSDDAESTITDKTSMGIDLSSDSHKALFLNKGEPWSSYSPRSNKGFLKIRLNNDFGHRDYYLALQSFFKLNVDSASAPAYPYNPTLQSFTMSYTASCELSPSSTDPATFDNRPLNFYHIGPFGDSEQHKVLQNTNAKLLSRLITSSGGVYSSQGSLFIGLENLLPGDTQAIFFQLQEGSEDPLLEKPENHLTWEYLSSNNVWKEFEDSGVGDNTGGLIESGIINFIIPKDTALVHTALESGLVWIRCSVSEAPDALCRIMGIYPNAVEVKRIIPEDTEYASMVAAPGEIKKLFVPEAKVKKIDQPYSSFDGKPTEASETFYIRASERLRHKNRAITIWDFERLVLQAFPEIYKVKCLNHTKITGSLSEGNLIYNEIAPGYVSVITIPSLANRNDIDPLKPYTKKSTLQKIEDFLNERTSCQVIICTAQPDFEEVKVKCTIMLRKEFPDINYYREVIQQDIVRFLSPWAFSPQTEVSFGGRVHQSVLIDFIEELPYVDFLTDFELIHITSSGTSTKVDEAIASTARSILVSVPAIKHDLNVMLKAGDSVEDIVCDNE
ncbi:MAG: hypothetical protein KFF73_02150 [Cyclobacteriaceae bacterium]|nr:hypothetical protein [Cyclobacteriaceae bacterium]